MARHIYIVIYDDAVLSSLAAPLDMFSRTAEMLAAQGRAEALGVTLVRTQRDPVRLAGEILFPGALPAQDLKPSRRHAGKRLLLVPAFYGDWDDVVARNASLVDWLGQHYRAGAEVASLCRGSYFLAEAGLLEGIRCTSHWSSADDLGQRYPNIVLQPDAVLTDQEGIYTGGGAFSSLNLVLYLIEKLCGHEVGLQVARNFSIHRDHVSQAHFAMFSSMTGHGDELIRKAQDYIESSYGSLAGVDDVAGHVNMSRRNFIRRFKQAVQMTPLEYIQRVRIEAAKRGLETSRANIESLVLGVGYNDVKTFRDVFRRTTGLTPQAYRQKYARLD